MGSRERSSLQLGAFEGFEVGAQVVGGEVVALAADIEVEQDHPQHRYRQEDHGDEIAEERAREDRRSRDERAGQDLGNPAEDPEDQHEQGHPQPVGADQRDAALEPRPPIPSISTTGETKAKRSPKTRPGMTKKTNPSATKNAAGMTADRSLPRRRKSSIQTSRHSALPPKTRSATEMVSAPFVSGTMMP